MRPAVVLFTRDLHAHDNVALSTAAREAELVGNWQWVTGYPTPIDRT